MRLSPEQQAAVTRTGQDVCVVAGPGSGKTRVLVERFCWLIRERRISPQRILAITFTEKAATEIRQRLAKEFAGQTEIREQVERAYVSTVHGFCARLLRENPIAAGLGPYFELPHTEMYGEHFDIPNPDELVFVSWFEGGEVFRSGVTFNRGNGKVFYFRPGHETYPIYHNPQVIKVLCNACRWAAPRAFIMNVPTIVDFILTPFVLNYWARKSRWTRHLPSSFFHRVI